MADQSKYEKSENKEEINYKLDDKIDHSRSEKEFDWDFILEREWSRTKK
ncbi:MAG: hypothetical protein ACTSO6_04385 [Promethearchaeota archaeon]